MIDNIDTRVSRKGNFIRLQFRLDCYDSVRLRIAILRLKFKVCVHRYQCYNLKLQQNRVTHDIAIAVPILTDLAP